MKNSESMIEAVKSLCKSALDGTLKLKQLCQGWPAEADTDPFLRQVYEDIEDGVEHIPGSFFKRKIDHESWESSEMYFVLYVDLLLLSHDRPTEELMRCRQVVLGQGTLTNKRAMEDKVKECLKIK